MTVTFDPPVWVALHRLCMGLGLMAAGVLGWHLLHRQRVPVAVLALVWLNVIRWLLWGNP